MPSRKQRRRREKLQRHEWELVQIDDEGNEIPVEPAQVKKKENGPAAARKPARARGSRTLREVPQPSWRRAVRRALPWQLGLLALVVFVFKGPLASRVGVGILYAIALVPFTYAVDRMAYRAYRKRLER